MMPKIDMSELIKLELHLAGIQKEMPDRLREIHEHLAVVAKQEVDAAISRSVSDTSGKVRGWQVSAVGSRGGYADVRPAGSKENVETGPNGPGAITNYLDRGYKIRRPGGKSLRYKPAIRVPFVRGRGFYTQPRSAVKGKAIHEAIRFLEDLAQKISGDGNG